MVMSNDDDDDEFNIYFSPFLDTECNLTELDKNEFNFQTYF